MDNTSVVLVPCHSYQKKDVYKSLCKGIAFLGGIEKLLGDRKNQHLLLKPNILVADPPGKGSTTHPSVFFAAAKLLTRANFQLSYGDSRAVGRFRKIVQKNGFKDVADLLDRLCRWPISKQVRRYIFKRVGRIAAKMKTHGFTVMTGAIKNMFGVVPAILSRKQSAKFLRREDSSLLLLFTDFTDTNRWVSLKFFPIYAFINACLKHPNNPVNLPVAHVIE